MSCFRLTVGLLAVSAFAGDAKLDALLKSVEARYNHPKSLQVLFHEEYKQTGHASKSESGTLFLSRPEKMRWEYTSPKGKLFICDGKNMWLYDAVENRAQKMSNLKESSDMKAPLAFLLGKLHFDKEFSNIKARPDGNNTRITAGPKTENLPYSAVEFLVTPDGVIREVIATGFDESVYKFRFDDEKLNAPVDSKLFQFVPPPGCEVVPVGDNRG